MSGPTPRMKDGDFFGRINELSFSADSDQSRLDEGEKLTLADPEPPGGVRAKRDADLPAGASHLEGYLLANRTGKALESEITDRIERHGEGRVLVEKGRGALLQFGSESARESTHLFAAWRCSTTTEPVRRHAPSSRRLAWRRPTTGMSRQATAGCRSCRLSSSARSATAKAAELRARTCLGSPPSACKTSSTSTTTCHSVVTDVCSRRGWAAEAADFTPPAVGTAGHLQIRRQ